MQEPPHTLPIAPQAAPAGTKAASLPGGPLGRLGLEVLLLGLSASLCPGGVLYRSDFKSLRAGTANLKQWKLSRGAYRVQDGWLCVSSERSNPLALLRAVHDGDGTFRATVRGARTCHWAGIVGRGAYRLSVNNQFGQLQLHRKRDGKWALVARRGGYWHYARSVYRFELRLVFKGNEVRGFIDDKKLVEYRDPKPPPRGGPCGLVGGWGTNVAWRDVCLSDVPDLTQWPIEESPSPAPAGLVKVTWVRGLSDDNIYFDGRQPGLKVRITTERRRPVQVALACKLLDVREAVVAEQKQSLRLEPGRQRELALRYRPPGRGCFKVALYASDGSQSGWVEDLGAFTVVPERVYERPRNRDSIFGGHMDGINLEWHLAAGRKIGIQWARCHDMLQHTWWTRVQPDGPERWKFGDRTQRTVDASGFRTLGEFLWTPKWASAKPGDARSAAQPPKDMDAFARYVARTVGHHRGSIRHWEVWNEPHYAGFWQGTPQQYARLLEVAYREAKKADPKCFVLGGGGVSAGRLEWTEKVIESLKGRPMDGFSIHYLDPDAADEHVAALRQLLARRGLQDVPIWNTEASVASTSFLDQSRRGRREPEARYHFRNACFELVRMYMTNIAAGVRRVFYYHQADPWRSRTFPKPRTLRESSFGTGMWGEGRMLRPVGAAHAALAYAIEGKRFRKRITVGRLKAFLFAGDEEATAVHFGDFRRFATRKRVRLPLPAGVGPAGLAVIDFMGNERKAEAPNGKLTLLLAREPVYLRCPGKDAASVLERSYRSAELLTD